MHVAGATRVQHAVDVDAIGPERRRLARADRSEKTSGPLVPTTQSYEMFNHAYNAQSASNIREQ